MRNVIDALEEKILASFLLLSTIFGGQNKATASFGVYLGRSAKMAPLW